MGANKNKKTAMTKEEVNELTNEVRAANRPINPWAEPKTPSPAPNSTKLSPTIRDNTSGSPSKHPPQKTGGLLMLATNGTNNNGSSSAYSSFSSGNEVIQNGTKNSFLFCLN